MNSLALRPWFQTGLSWGLCGLWLCLLAYVPLAKLGGFGFAFVWMLSSALIYVHLSRLLLLRRRALIQYVFSPDSPVARLLWRSIVSQLGAAILAVILALGSLIAAAQLAPWEWALLGASVLTLSGWQWVWQQLLSAHIQPVYRRHVILRVAAWCNLGLLSMGLLAGYFWWVEVPATQHLTWLEVVQAQSQTQDFATPDESGFALIDAVLQASQGLQALVWHLIQWLSQSTPWWLSGSIFILLVLGVMLQVALIWLVLLGIHSLLIRVMQAAHTTGSEKNAQQLGLARAHVLIGVTVAGLALLLWGYFERQMQTLPERNIAVSQTTPEDPCSPAALQRSQALFGQAAPQLSAEQSAAAMAAIQPIVATHLDRAFSAGEQGIDAFLDWNFSLAGQYTQLVFVAQAQLSDESFETLLQSKLSEFTQTQLAPALRQAERQLATDIQHVLVTQAQQYQAQTQALLPQTQAMCFDWSDLQFDSQALVRKSAVGAGVVPGLALAARGLAPASAIGVRAGTRRVLAMLSGRMVVRSGATATATTAGTVCGPLCMMVLGGATWLGTDLVLNYADEKLNRDSLREPLVDALAQQRLELELQLLADAERWVHLFFYEMEQAQQQRFNMSRELLHESDTPRR
ncbi:hypothetical protein [Aliidiomarina maris]|nr:hypothetical protein [Aliidiomarina maris]